MSYDGIEIFMMSIGNADCFLVIRYYPDGTQETVLADGGNKSSACDIAERLKGLGISHIDHIVNTHPHDDHASGLVELISSRAFTFGNLWMHQAWRHVDFEGIKEQLGRNSAKWVLDRFKKSIATQEELFKLSVNRGVTPLEPFAGAKIGPFTVIGPTEAFYVKCLQCFGDTDKVKQWNDYLQAQSEVSSVARLLSETMQDDNPLGDVTSPENESSVIMITIHENQKLFFCGDAGCKAFSDLNDLGSAPSFKDIHWMHAPHHGSRRNLWPELVDYLNPNIVYMSCKGSKKHPSRKLVNRFKNQCQTKVYASYYPKVNNFIWIRSAYGKTPERDLKAATPLYEAG